MNRQTEDPETDAATEVSGDRRLRRFPTSVYCHGSEPDARFSFANERTFLAWIRTALALIACGVGLDAFGSTLQPHLRIAAALTLIAVGVAVPVHAWFAWARSERALRRGEPLPSPFMSAPLGVAVVVIGVLNALAVVLG